MLRFLKMHAVVVRRCAIMAALLVAAVMFFVFSGNSMKADKLENMVYSVQPHDVSGEDDIYYEKLVGGKTLRQTVVTDTSMQGFVLEFHAEYPEMLSGKTYVTMEDEYGNVVHHSEMENAKTVRDGYTYFLVDDGTVDAGKYVIKVYSDVETKEQALDIYLENSDIYEGALTVDGKSDEGRAMCLGVYVITKLPQRLFGMTVFMSVAALAVSLAVFYVFRLKTHVAFFISAFCLGLVYMFLISPGTGCDSDVHFVISYDCSNVLLFKGSINDNDGNLVMRGGDYEAYKRLFCIDDSYQAVMSKDGFMDLKDLKELFISNDEMVDVPMGEQGVSWISYTPLIVGLALGRLLGLGSVLCMYLARLVALVMYLSMIAVAIKITPVCKEMFALVGLLPMNLCEYSAFSYDGMGISSAYLFVACWLNCLVGKPEGRDRKVNIALWIFSAALLGGAKQGSFLFFLLLIIAVTNVYATIRERLAVAGTMTLAAVGFNASRYLGALSWIGGIIAFAADDGLYLTERGRYSLAYGVHHPIKFFYMSLGSVLERFDYYLGSMLGTHLTANTSMMPVAVVVPFLFAIILVSFKTYANDSGLSDNMSVKGSAAVRFGRRMVAVLALTILANVFVLFFMMQLSTPYGWNNIGVTGRYFLPLLPMVFLLFWNCRIMVHEDTQNKVIVGFLWWHMVEIFYAAWFILTR